MSKNFLKLICIRIRVCSSKSNLFMYDWNYTSDFFFFFFFVIKFKFSLFLSWNTTKQFFKNPVLYDLNELCSSFPITLRLKITNYLKTKTVVRKAYLSNLVYLNYEKLKSLFISVKRKVLEVFVNCMTSPSSARPSMTFGFFWLREKEVAFQ